MSDIVAVREALAGRLSGINGLRASATVLDAIAPPAAVVGEVEIDFDQSFARGLDELRFKVRLYASRASERSGQQTLDSYLAGSGTKSVKANLEADKTLSGVVETLIVRSVTGYGVYEVAGTLYLGAEFAITVWTKGTS